MKKLLKNYFYNITIQLFLIVVPVITTPYISRVLGAELIGIRSYSYSIFTWFSLASCLGVSTYGLKEIAFVRESKEKRSIVFFELLCVKVILFVLVFFFYVLFLIKQKTNLLIYSIFIIELIANLFDITWFYQGIEEVKTVAIKNLIVKTFFIVFLFAFIKDKSDFYLYLITYSLSILIGNLTFWFKLYKYINIQVYKVNIKHLIIHLKYCFQLFIPMIAYSLYTVLDRTMIGLLTSSNLENAYYEQSQNIVKLATTIILAMNVVLVPRMATLSKHNDSQQISESLLNILKINLLLSIPVSFGIFSISDGFVPWFLGNEFKKVIILLKLLSPIPILMGLSTCITSVYLNIINKHNFDTICVFAAAVINILLNMILIPTFMSKGAIVSSIIAELCSAIMHLYFISNIVSLKKLIIVFVKYSFCGFLMAIFVRSMSHYLAINIISTLFEIIFGAATYFIMLYVIHDDIVYKYMYRVKDKFLNR